MHYLLNSERPSQSRYANIVAFTEDCFYDLRIHRQHKSLSATYA